MKRLVIAFAFASIFAACNNNTKTSTNADAARDSVKMLQYSMRAMRDSLRIDSLEKAAAQATLLKQQAEQQSQRVVYTPAPRRNTYVKGVSESYYYTPSKPVKKGWSAAAKGAAIGAGAGALTGVIIDKKDARGGIIGGLIGAGTGYVIGRAQDRKSGRVQ